MEKNTKKYFAIKVLCKAKIVEKRSEEAVVNERKFLAILDNPYVLHVKTVVF